MASSADPRFLRPHTDAHIKRIADALLNTDGVTLGEDEARVIASMTLTPSGDLVHRGALSPSRVLVRRNRLGQKMVFLKADTMPVLPNPSNPRIEPDMRRLYQGTKLPRPTTATTATHIEFHYDTDTDLLDHYRRAQRALRERVTVQKRGYDLAADMSFRGQQEPGVAVLAKVAFSQGGTAFTQPRLVSVSGANRATAKLELTGIALEDLLFANADLRKFWTGYYADLQQIASIGDPAASDDLDKFAAEPRMGMLARKLQAYGLEAALKNLCSPNLILIGAPDSKGDLVGELDALNLDDHLHPPASFDDDARGLALFGAIVQRYMTDGLITPEKAEVLLGRAEPSVGGYADLGAVRLDMIRVLFPQRLIADKERQIIRELLAEPVGTQTNNDHALARCRVLGAAYFGGAKNVRVVDKLFTYNDTRNGVDVPWETMADLLSSAASDADAAAFLTRLGPVVLADVDCYEAARGSDQQRREPDNLQKALDRDRALALPVLAAAMEAGPGGTPVLRDADGTTEVIDADWIFRRFPKKAAAPMPALAPAPSPVVPVDPAAELLGKEDVALRLAQDVAGAIERCADAMQAMLDFAQDHGLPVRESYFNLLMNAHVDAEDLLAKRMGSKVNATRRALRSMGWSDEAPATADHGDGQL